MPDIFLSYNRESQARAKLCTEAFRAHEFEVWRDAGLKTGEAYDEVTETALRTAKSVVVLWSSKSVLSRWVGSEATLADRNKNQVPRMTEPCGRPIMFERTPTAELSHRQGEMLDRVWLGFLADVARLAGRGRAPALAPTLPMQAAGMAKVTPGQRGARPSVAILPFTNRSGELVDEVFASGVGEDIAAALSLGRGLKVISQSATAAYRKNPCNLRAIGQELGAKYILEGNVRRVGQSLRVTAQLMEADCGAILWTQTFDRPLSEVAELSEVLVEELSAHRGAQIQKVEMERALKKPGDITAWDSVMRSWVAYAGPTLESLNVAIQEARRGASFAPDYAVARGTLSMGLSTRFQQTGHRDQALIDEALEQAEIALALNANRTTLLFQVVHAFGNAKRFAEALQLTERAVALDPNLIDPRQVLAFCLNHFEHYEEALVQLAEGDRVAPRSFQQPGSHVERSWALYGLDRLEGALASITEFARFYPSHLISMLTLPAILQALCHREEAQEAIRKARNARPSEGLDFWLGFARGAYMSEALLRSFSQHFSNAWSATALDTRT